MISSKYDFFFWKSNSICYLVNKIPVISRFHTCISTKLIYLICSCFNKNIIIKSHCLLETSFYHKIRSGTK